MWGTYTQLPECAHWGQRKVLDGPSLTPHTFTWDRVSAIILPPHPRARLQVGDHVLLFHQMLRIWAQVFIHGPQVVLLTKSFPAPYGWLFCFLHYFFSLLPPLYVSLFLLLSPSLLCVFACSCTYDSMHVKVREQPVRFGSLSPLPVSLGIGLRSSGIKYLHPMNHHACLPKDEY